MERSNEYHHMKKAQAKKPRQSNYKFQQVGNQVNQSSKRSSVIAISGNTFLGPTLICGHYDSEDAYQDKTKEKPIKP